MLVKPSAATVKKYGLTDPEWEEIADRQGRVCAVCGKLPRSGRLHIDHDHVRGWKKLSPSLRRLFVRGLACFRCNTQFIGRGATVAILEGAVKYLIAYAERSAAAAAMCQHADARVPDACYCGSGCPCRVKSCVVKKAKRAAKCATK